MNFEKLVGRTFQEKEFYELLLFEIEENFEQYFSKCAHFYFERIQDNKVKITEVLYFENRFEMNKTSRACIEKKEWFELAQNHNHVDLLLCRFDRTGTIAVIWRDSTITHDWRHGWADEVPNEPMTDEQVRLGFQELAGFFQGQQDIQNLKSKKAI